MHRPVEQLLYQCCVQAAYQQADITKIEYDTKGPITRDPYVRIDRTGAPVV